MLSPSEDSEQIITGVTQVSRPPTEPNRTSVQPPIRTEFGHSFACLPQSFTKSRLIRRGAANFTPHHNTLADFERRVNNRTENNSLIISPLNSSLSDLAVQHIEDQTLTNRRITRDMDNNEHNSAAMLAAMLAPEKFTNRSDKISAVDFVSAFDALKRVNHLTKLQP